VTNIVTVGAAASSLLKESSAVGGDETLNDDESFSYSVSPGNFAKEKLGNHEMPSNCFVPHFKGSFFRSIVFE
jgi:hypothetical protein